VSISRVVPIASAGRKRLARFDQKLEEVIGAMRPDECGREASPSREL